MLDFDAKHSGAADLQVQVGAVRLTVGGELVSYMVDERVKFSLNR